MKLSINVKSNSLGCKAMICLFWGFGSFLMILDGEMERSWTIPEMMSLDWAFSPTLRRVKSHM